MVHLPPVCLSPHHFPFLFPLFRFLDLHWSPHCPNHHQRKPFRSCFPSPWHTAMENGKSGCEDKVCPCCGEILRFFFFPFSMTGIIHWPGKVTGKRERGGVTINSLCSWPGHQRGLWKSVTSKQRWELLREIPLTSITCWAFGKFKNFFFFTTIKKGEILSRNTELCTAFWKLEKTTFF